MQVLRVVFNVKTKQQPQSLLISIQQKSQTSTLTPSQQQFEDLLNSLVG